MQQEAKEVTQWVRQVADMEFCVSMQIRLKEYFYGKWEELCEILKLITKE